MMWTGTLRYHRSISGYATAGGGYHVSFDAPFCALLCARGSRDRAAGERGWPLIVLSPPALNIRVEQQQPLVRMCPWLLVVFPKRGCSLVPVLASDSILCIYEQ